MKQTYAKIVSKFQFQKMNSCEKPDPESNKQDTLDSSANSESFMNSTGDVSTDAETSLSRVQCDTVKEEPTDSPVKLEVTGSANVAGSPVKPVLAAAASPAHEMKHSLQGWPVKAELTASPVRPVVVDSVVKQEQEKSPLRTIDEGAAENNQLMDSGENQEQAEKARDPPVTQNVNDEQSPEPESSLNFAVSEACLLTSSPVRGANGGASSSCASSLSPVRAQGISPVHTAASGSSSSPVKLDTQQHVVTGTKDPVDSSVGSSHDRTRSGDSSDHPHPSCGALMHPDSEVPSCSTVSSDNGEIDSTREEGELDSSSVVETNQESCPVGVKDSDMDTQVDVVSHSESYAREATHSERRQEALVQEASSSPEEQQGTSSATGHSSQGFEATPDTQKEQSSSQVDSSEGSIVDTAAPQSSDAHNLEQLQQPCRSRHESAADCVDSSRSRHQSAADSVSVSAPVGADDASRPDSRQDLLQGSDPVSSGVAMQGPDTAAAEASAEQPSGSGDVEEGEVSENEERVGSSGKQEELEEGEIEDSDEERSHGNSPTSSSAQPAAVALPSESSSVSAADSAQPGEGPATAAPAAPAARDEQAVSCSTDSGVEVSSGEDLNQSAGSVSDGEIVQSTSNGGLVLNAGDSTETNQLIRTNSQNQISSSDYTSSQTLSAISAGISSDTGALQTCSSTDSLVGSSNRTAGLFSSRFSSSSLTSCSSSELKENCSDTEVDSTSSHWQTVSRSGLGVHSSRSPADVSSSSSAPSQDALVSNSRLSSTFTSRWPSGATATVTTPGAGDLVAEEPSSSETTTPPPSGDQAPHASTTFLCSSAAHPSSTTSTSPAPQNKKKVCERCLNWQSRCLVRKPGSSAQFC